MSAIEEKDNIYIINMVILPSIYLERLLLPFQRSRNSSMSQALLYQKDLPISSIDGQVERTSIAYASVNRFFCAFIDHVSGRLTEWGIKNKYISQGTYAWLLYISAADL